MRLLKLALIAIVIFFAASAMYGKAPLHYKYAISDWFARLGSPDFTVGLDSFTTREQSEIVREYKNRGHELKCYGNLRKEEKIGRNSDYLCNTYIGSAYDNIPARMATFFFYKEKLTHIRIEFPDTSFAQLHDFLSRKLSKYPRLDSRGHHDFGTDNFGKPLMVWAVKEGIVTTSAEKTDGQTIVLLWSSMSTPRLMGLLN